MKRFSVIIDLSDTALNLLFELSLGNRAIYDTLSTSTKEIDINTLQYLKDYGLLYINNSDPVITNLGKRLIYIK